jgi:hypothetical protein
MLATHQLQPVWAHQQLHDHPNPHTDVDADVDVGVRPRMIQMIIVACNVMTFNFGICNIGTIISYFLYELMHDIVL